MSAVTPPPQAIGEGKCHDAVTHLASARRQKARGLLRVFLWRLLFVCGEYGMDDPRYQGSGIYA